MWIKIVIIAENYIFLNSLPVITGLFRNKIKLKFMTKLIRSYPLGEHILPKQNFGILKPTLLFLLTILMLILTIMPVSAQQSRKVTGTVTNLQSQPIPGASIVLKGTFIGTSTDADGKFTIDVSGQDAILVVSFLGYAPQEVAVGSQNVINVNLVEDVKSLSEVVVVGYGTQRKKDVTGAVAVLGSEEFKDRPNTQFGYAIEGKAAGVQVIRPSGQPQAGFSIRVRGTSTITAGSEPLYLVDGVPTTSINEINPADIESMTVLKDASAAAIYGSSGSNGVVLITTKRGGNQKTKVSFDTYFGTSKVAKTLDVLNGEQYKALVTEMGQTTDWSLYTNPDGSLINSNWQDQAFRTAYSQNYQLGVTGGNENTNFYISGSWMKQEGIEITNELSRYNFKTNLDHKVNKNLKVGTSISYNRWRDVSVNETGRWGAINSLITGAPVTNVYNSDGTFCVNPFIPDLENPIGLILQNEHSYVNARFLGNIYAEISFLNDFKFRSMFGYEQLNGTYNAWVDPYRSVAGRNYQGVADLNTNQKVYWISENTLSYNKTFDKHSLTALAGVVTSETEYNSSEINARGFGGSAVQTVNGGSTRTVVASTSQRRNVSFISRVNYGYDDRYLLTANFRADASTVFSATDNVWGYFPSFSAGWRISKEKFFTGLDFINDLKLRVGYGEVGNDQVGDYASYGLVNAGSVYVNEDNVIPGTSPITLENTNLKWETTKQTNIGLDIAFLENRVLFTTDYYIKKTTDMLLDRPIPASVGLPGNTATKNIGEMENRGYEFQISSNNLSPDNELKWTTDFNISFNKSEIISLDGGTIKVGNITDRGTCAIAQEGQPLGMFYGYIFDGVDPATGNSIYRDLDDDGALSDGDKTIIGNSNPDYTWGLTNTLSYKGWSFNFFFHAVQGNDIFNASRIETEAMSIEANQLATVANRWTTPGQITDVPRATYGDFTNSLTSSRFVEDGSFVRLKSISLGYEFPKQIISKLNMSRLYVYVSSENLLTFTKYSGFDPEVSVYSLGGFSNSEKNIAPGVDYGTYPQSREFLIGLNITF
jgi:TonB-linked SusC/RagA family outer membrane protein